MESTHLVPNESHPLARRVAQYARSENTQWFAKGCVVGLVVGVAIGVLAGKR